MYNSKNFNGKQFVNPVPTTVSKPGTFWNTIWEFMVGREQRVPARKIGPFTTDTQELKRTASDKIRVTWFGHSSVLLEIEGKRFLTDPVWGSRSSPVNFAGPARFFAPTIPLQDLPPLDGVIISHDHYDHFDPVALKILSQTGITFYVPLGVEQHFRNWQLPAGKVVSCDWGDTVSLPNGFNLYCTPARHFSGRGLKRNNTLWASWVITSPQYRVYYGGDSGYFPGFKEIGNTYGPFDLTLLEIGAYHENWGEIHMGPANALQAHLDLKGKLLLPIHWGLFNLAFHAWTAPVEELVTLAQEQGVSLFLPVPGEPTILPEQNLNTNWWAAYK
ncbi:MBL fold metallo-hydrolase [Adhaeribacter arboris]|uniref:MBL fold metallo-hydrolase n=1 Tax=Adhaeribacter arboris TaxID=2072846 RepID=A0A2T2YGI2_9BACT|nr:MBL fold metallo-hydrolase [Adhaeribacter arboris]PSR54614.1 MBL fold metallo-hydrolase [Adhaeribacter arboris]